MGTVRAEPEHAEIDVGATATAPEAKTALSQSSAIATRLLSALDRLGIPRNDIQSRTLIVLPQYASPQRGEAARVVGYRATHRLGVTVRPVDRLGGVIDALVSEGANLVGGIRFALDDPAKAEDEARRQALGNARRHAQVYAEAAGVTLGKLMELQEGEPRTMQPQLQRLTAEAMSSTPIASGEIEVRVTLSATYAIE